jgi:7-cyano-7-deazaguanine synthase
MTFPQKAILLASGGLDSTTLAYWLLDNGCFPVPVHVDYGQHSASTELKALRKSLPEEVTKQLKTISIRGLYESSMSAMIHERDLWTTAISDDDLHVSFRNQILLSLGASAAAQLGLEVVYSAFISGNVATGADCTTSYLSDLAKFVNSSGGISLSFPFLQYSKLDVARIGLQLGAPLEKTYSCLARSSTPCGSCPNCIDRNEAISILINEIQ